MWHGGQSRLCRSVLASFGGLLLNLKGKAKDLEDFFLGQNVYILLRKA